MSRVTNLFSFWALVAFVMLAVLQWFPLTGIFLMVLGGALWCGLAVHAFLLGLAVEAALGKVPRVLMIVPILAYGAYYVEYVKQAREIGAKSQELAASNPSKVLQFDPAVHSLVLPRPDAELIASRYEAAVTYEVNPNFKPEGYMSHRLLDLAQCGEAERVRAPLREQNRVIAFGMKTPVQLGPGRVVDEYAQGVCLLNFPEKPPLQPLTVTEHGGGEAWRRERGITDKSTEFSLGGKLFATYRTATVWRMPKLPLFYIGCALNSGAPSWDCSADFFSSHEIIDGTPEGVDRTLYDNPASIVLGLRKYAKADYADFKGNAAAAAFIEKIAGYAQAQADYKTDHQADLFKMFAAFVKDTRVETTGSGVTINIVYDGNTGPPAEMEGAILEKPEQLVPLSEAMAARFVQLVNGNVISANKWLKLLEKCLVALPHEAFATMPDEEVRQVLDALGSHRGWDYYRFLYLRMTEAGPRTLGFYEGELTKSQRAGGGRASWAMSPELAICRLGEGSEQTRAILRKEFTEHSQSDRFDDNVTLNSAVFVTLLKLGDALADGGAPASFTRDEVVSWYDAVREGKGRTGVGPNNCEGWQRAGSRDANWLRRLPPPLRPSLIYQDKAWIEAKAS